MHLHFLFVAILSVLLLNCINATDVLDAGSGDTAVLDHGPYVSGPCDNGPCNEGDVMRADVGSVDSAWCNSLSVDLSTELYAADRLPQFELTLTEAALQALAADPYTYVVGDFAYGAENVTQVGVRLKGTTTFQPIDAKPSFKIKFDKFVDGQFFRGLRRLTLNNATKDASYLAERIAYRLYRAACLPAPRANNALVYVNGVLRGVYVNVEAEDKTFLRRWYADDSGNLYESAFEDVAPHQAEAFELETNETTNDRSDLTELCAASENITRASMLSDLEPYLNTRQWLRFWAWEALVLQRDGYAFLLYGDDMPGNYRLYHDPVSSKFEFIPWSMDRSMKPPHLNVWASYTYLTWNCLQDITCRAAYAAALDEAVELFEMLPLETELDAAHDLILPWVEVEALGPGVADFEMAVANVREAINSRATDIRSDLESR